MSMAARAGILYQTPGAPLRRPEPSARVIIIRDGERAAEGRVAGKIAFARSLRRDA